MAVFAGFSLIAGVTSAFAAVTPGWECIPTTAGQAVVSGGTAASPSCAGGATAVLAPTYVSSGVGGRPTVAFSTVNVQVVSGSGSTNGAVNGEGNLVVGYAENGSGHPQSGSNDLVVGSNNGWSGYGELVGGSGLRPAARTRPCSAIRMSLRALSPRPWWARTAPPRTRRRRSPVATTTPRRAPMVRRRPAATRMWRAEAPRWSAAGPRTPRAARMPRSPAANTTRRPTPGQP